jgi:hypothetical protein
MSIDTLGFSKYLQDHGVEREQAEAHAEAANRYLFPQLATKADLDKVEASLTMRTIAIVGAIDALLFTLLKLS